MKKSMVAFTAFFLPVSDRRHRTRHILGKWSAGGKKRNRSRVGPRLRFLVHNRKISDQVPRGMASSPRIVHHARYSDDPKGIQRPTLYQQMADGSVRRLR